MLDFIHLLLKPLEFVVGWVFSGSWLPPKDFSLFRWLFVPGEGYGFVLVGLGILELIIPQVRRPVNRSTLLSTTYLMFAGKMSIYAFVVAPLMRKAWLYFDLPSLHLDRTMPLAVYMPLSALVVTFTAYWAHRCMHRIPICWHIHKIHHSVRNLNWSSVYHKHFLELLLETPSHLIIILALGTDLVAPMGIIFMTIDVLGHSNVRLDFGRWSYLFSTPQAHRIHHSIEPRHYDTNFGNTFMIWDHVFGTFCHETGKTQTSYGVNEPIPESFIKQQILPLMWIARTAKAGILRIYSGPRTQVQSGA